MKNHYINYSSLTAVRLSFLRLTLAEWYFKCVKYLYILVLSPFLTLIRFPLFYIRSSSGLAFALSQSTAIVGRATHQRLIERREAVQWLLQALITGRFVHIITKRSREIGLVLHTHNLRWIRPITPSTQITVVINIISLDWLKQINLFAEWSTLQTLASWISSWFDWSLY